MRAIAELQAVLALTARTHRSLTIASVTGSPDSRNNWRTLWGVVVTAMTCFAMVLLHRVRPVRGPLELHGGWQVGGEPHWVRRSHESRRVLRGREPDRRFDEVEFGLDVGNSLKLHVEDGLLLFDLCDLALNEIALLLHFKLKRRKAGCDTADGHRGSPPEASVGRQEHGAGRRDESLRHSVR